MIRSLAEKLDTRWIKLLWLTWTWVLPAIILVVVVFKLANTPKKLSMLLSLEILDWSSLAVCLVLLPLNVGLEAYKWKLILKPVQEISIWASAKIILAGRSLNVISPFGIGDAFAKYMGTTLDHRAQTIGGVTIDRFSQLVPTIIIGIVSVSYLIERGFSVPLKPILWSVISVTFLAMVALLFGKAYKNKIKGYVQLIDSINMLSLSKIVGAAFLRYAVFTFQFLCIFWWLGVELPIQALILGIAWIFLIKTVVPNLSVLGDLMKRELSTVLFFSYFLEDLSAVMMTSFVVWVINIVVPAVVGLGFVSEIKKAF